MVRGNRRAQVLQGGKQARPLPHRQYAVGFAADVRGRGRLRDGAVLGDHVPIPPVFLRDLPVLRQRGVVVVAGGVRREAVGVVGAVHKAKIGAAVEHVEVHMAQLQHFVQVLDRFLQIAPHVPAVAPVVEPADPELRTHQGRAGPVGR